MAQYLFRCIQISAIIVLATILPASSQKATVTIAEQEILTYPFSDPNPITTLISRPGIYPYHRFDGYSQEGVLKKWKVVTLENDYLKVFILPEVGGKVWGAIEKSTGKDFIYKNDVIKFRNIAMRGPWTSGGIEFNFGLIGHHPGTATPVDFITSTDKAGNVSCTIGTMDLPSRTHWRVKITLPRDKAYFTTDATWYNPTALTHPYYNWMTAAAATSDDLVFYYPGNVSLHHSGETTEWPVNNDGRQLSYYRENDFGPSKSYHVVGQYHNFFGGYWHNEEIGFGHAGRHETMPGQKLWLWSLARDGGIWEDLLTDNNGQYMEFQAGRLLNQYFNEAYENPITEMAFAPHLTDRWQERWFPVKQTGGITAVSENVVLGIIWNEDAIILKLNALEGFDEQVKVMAQGEIIVDQRLSMTPMSVSEIRIDRHDAITIYLGEEILYSDKDEASKKLKRPYEWSKDIRLGKVQESFLLGSELSKKRRYKEAKAKLQECIKLDPIHLQAHKVLSEIHYRNGVYDSALYHANYALKLNTYDFDANYIAGLTYKALGDKYNALDALGIAGRSMEYRSAAFTEMAGMELLEGNMEMAIRDAQYALQFNTENMRALQILALAHRKNKELAGARRFLDQILAIDPLNHFGYFEKYLLTGKEEDLVSFKKRITNEFIYQSYLEIASIYLNAGLFQDAIAVLRESPDHPLINLWQAYCHAKSGQWHGSFLDRALSLPTAFIFPYRQESIQVLEWASDMSTSWKLKYYLGLNYWAKNRMEDAVDMFLSAGNPLEVPFFYVMRGNLIAEVYGHDPLTDLKRALSQGMDNWRYHHEIIKYFEEKRQYQKQLDHSTVAFEFFPNNHVIGLDHAQALVNNAKYDRSLQILKNIRVLPSEGSFSGRAIFGRATLFWTMELIEKGDYELAKQKLALSYLYPENLGSGKPFEPDERMINFLMAHIENKLGRSPRLYYERIIEYENRRNADKLSILKLYALEFLGQEEAVQEYLKELNSSSHPDTVWVINRWKNKLPFHEIINVLLNN